MFGELMQFICCSHKATNFYRGWDEFEAWLRRSVTNYMLVVFAFKQKRSESERLHKQRKRQMQHSARQREEQQQLASRIKNRKIESILQPKRSKENSTTEEKFGMDLYIERQIDELDATLTPFVMLKLQESVAPSPPEEVSPVRNIKSPNSNISTTLDVNMLTFDRRNVNSRERSSRRESDLSHTGRSALGSRDSKRSISPAGTARTNASGLTSKPGSVAQVEMSENIIRLFVEKLAALIRTYFKYPLELTKV